MEQVVEATHQQALQENSTDTNQMLSEKLEHLKPSAIKMEKARKFFQKVDPEKFKAVTGRDLFKK